MPESKKFDVGDVGQLVTGGTVNSGGNASVNNVVHLTVVSEKSTPISDLQRKALLAKIGDVIGATGLTPTELRMEIFGTFGINRLSDLPVVHFQEALALLERWEKMPRIEGFRAPGHVSTPNRPSPHHVTPRSPGTIAPNLLLQFTHTRYLIVLVGLALASITIATGWASSTRAMETPPTCEWDGKRYSLGSTVVMYGKKARCEMQDVDSKIAVWWEM